MFVIKKQDQYGVLCLFLSTQGRERVLFVFKFWVDYSNVMFFFGRVYALWMTRSAEGGRGRSQSGERRYMGQ